MHDEPQLAIRTNPGRVVHTDIVWEDPVGVASSTHRDAGATVSHHKPKLSKPLRPGMWKVRLLHSGGAVYQTVTFMVTRALSSLTRRHL